MVEKKTQKKGPATATNRSMRKKKADRDVTYARAHIQCTFNNTIVSITDSHGGVISWATAGSCGFSGTKKGTPFASQVTANRAATKAKEWGVSQVAVYVRGPGSGRDADLLLAGVEPVRPGDGVSLRSARRR